MNASDIQAGRLYYYYTGSMRIAEGSIDRVEAINGDYLVVVETHGRGQAAHVIPGPAHSWQRDSFAECHEPVDAPIAPVASQHPADLKPRGVKAPMYLIPWAAVPFVLLPDSLANAASAVGNWPDGDPWRKDHNACAFAHDLIVDVVQCHGFTLEDAARAFEHGAKKYARDNWRSFAWDAASKDEYFGAICRHLLAGVDAIDPDSGLKHGAHVLAGALIWAWHEGRS